MVRKIVLNILVVGMLLYAQTTITRPGTQTQTTIGTRQTNIGSSSRSWGRDTRRGNLGTTGRRDSQYDRYREAQIANFLSAIIGSYLRHPDPKVRIQAIQSLTGAMVGAEGTTGTSDRTGVRGLFSINTDRGSTQSEGGVGSAMFIPDLFILLNDPDPEVRDMAAIGLDALFGTDTAILRFMDDEDPIVRQYAAKIYATRSFSGEVDTRNRRDNEYYGGDLRELIALRTLLVRLKYEKDEGVRKVLTDSIELYLQNAGITREGTRTTSGRDITGIFGVDPSIFKYLEDENPEVRKNAIRIITSLEYNPQILNLLLERLKKETDEDVKKEIQQGIDRYISGRVSRTTGERVETRSYGQPQQSYQPTDDTTFRGFPRIPGR